VKDEFLLHKKSLKLGKQKKYKNGKGNDSQTVSPLVLPRHWDKRRYSEIKKNMHQEPFNAKDVKIQAKAEEQQQPAFQMNMPG